MKILLLTTIAAFGLVFILEGTQSMEVKADQRSDPPMNLYARGGPGFGGPGGGFPGLGHGDGFPGGGNFPGQGEFGQQFSPGNPPITPFGLEKPFPGKGHHYGRGHHGFGLHRGQE